MKMLASRDALSSYHKEFNLFIFAENDNYQVNAKTSSAGTSSNVGSS